MGPRSFLLAFLLLAFVVVLGLLLLVAGTVVNILGRFSLGGNWGDQIRIYRDHGLVTGGVVVAPKASELILPIAMAIQNHLTVDQLAHTIAIYPSLSGSVTEAARQLMLHGID